MVLNTTISIVYFSYNNQHVLFDNLIINVFILKIRYNRVTQTNVNQHTESIRDNNLYFILHIPIGLILVINNSSNSKNKIDNCVIETIIYLKMKNVYLLV